MPKTYTFKTLHDEALQLDASKLKNWGYLNLKQIKSGTLNWSKNGNNTGSISIKVNTLTNQPFLLPQFIKYGSYNEPSGP